MLDFILGAALAALAVRGWLRGFVKEILDLIALVAGIWIAFRLSAPLGDFFTQSFGVTPEIARIGSGILLFFLFGVSLSVAAHFLTKVMKLPGLNMVNRVGGVVVAATWGLILVLVAVNILRVTPLPESVGETMEESRVIQTIAGPDAVPQRWFHRLAGDRVLIALQILQDLFGKARLVPEGNEVIEIPPARDDEIRQIRSEAERIFEELNRYRTGEDLGAFQMSTGLHTMAERVAAEMYTSGRLGRSVDCLRRAAAEPGVSLAVCTDLVALAGSALGGFDGIITSNDGMVVLARSDLDRAGVAVVEGPLGRLVLIVLGG